MPTGGPGSPGQLTPPQTRVTQMWSHFWRSLAVDNPRRTERARTYSANIRRRRSK